MSLLENLIVQYIKDGDEKQNESIGKQVMQKHPIIYLSKCSEILDDLAEINNEYLRILRIIVQAAGLLTKDENSKLSVIQCIQVLKGTIHRILLLQTPNEEINQLLTDIHIKLMEVFDELVINHISDFFESGRVPELVILKIIQSIFESQAKECFRQFAYEVLQKILSSLSQVKTDQNRIDYCNLLQAIYKMLIHFEENQITINQEQVYNVSWLIFDQIIKDWLQGQIQFQVLSLIGFMTQFIGKDRLERNLEKLSQVYVNFLKQKNNQLRPLFEGFNKFLERLYKLDRLAYEGIIKSMMVSLYEFYKSPIFSPNYPFDPQVLKYKNDLLSLLQTVSQFNIDNCLDLFIGRINSKDNIERVACLWICNFLLSRNFKQISEPYKRQLVLQLLNLQFEQDTEVRYAICEIILQICFKLKDDEQSIISTYLDMKALLFYLFNQVAIHDKELEEYGKVRSTPFETTLEILKQRAQKILTTLAQDSFFYDLLWPMGLEIINNQKFSPGLSHIFKCYSIVLQKGQFNITYQSPHIIIVRMLLLIQIPYFFSNLGLEAVTFLPYLIKVFDLKVGPSFYQNIEVLKQYLSNKRGIDEFYEEKVQQIWRMCLGLFIQQKELQIIEEDFQSQMNMYLNSQALKLPIMKMQATLLSFLTNQETIKYNLDRLFGICHQEYTNQALNLNIPNQEPEFNLRLCVAECFGYIGERHTQLVLDKMKAILNCEVIQKKNTGSFKDSVFSMFQKNGTEDYVASFRGTLLIAYGCLAKQSNLEVLEKNILPNVMPFIGQEQLFNSLQIALEQISKAIERIIENSEEGQSSSFLLSYQKYREQVLQHCIKNIQRGNILKNLNTLNLQYRLQSLKYQKAKIQLSQHIDQKFDYSLEQVNITFQNCFLLFLGSVTLEDDEDNGIISVWQSLLYLITQIKNNDILIEILQKSIQRVKLKFEQSYKNYFKVILALLSILYKNTESKRSVVLILEKILLSLGVYLDIYQKTDEEFNIQLIKSLREKLQMHEITLFIQEINLLIQDPPVESLSGFVSLIECIYNSGYKDLEQIISLLEIICLSGNGKDNEEQINLSLSKCLNKITQQHLQESLHILLDKNQQFPLSTFQKLLLKSVGQQKQSLIQSFAFLTDVLNNPEEIITGDIGNYLINASLFIGQILGDENQILIDLIPKQMAGILGTFILRFMTCHDIKLCGSQQSLQSAIWAFQNLLNICNIDGISQHVLKKLLNEEEVEDGIQEIVMIYCKGASFSDLKKLFNFIKDFTTKEQQSYRIGAIIVISQFIRSHKNYEQKEFYQDLLQTLLQFAEDDSENVRAQVGLGLGAVSYYLKAEQILSEQLTQDILECLIELLDDQSEICVKSAMISLQNLVDALPDTVAYLPQLMIATTTNFEKSMTKIRISAFSLFSKLCHLCHTQSIMNESIMTYLRQALVSIMLHLLDESVQVRQVCKLSLENIGDLLNNNIFKQLSENNENTINLKDYNQEHLEENEKIIMVMILNLEEDYLQIYIKSLIEFCKSPEHNIKGAAMFSLILLLAFRNVGDFKGSIEQICQEPKLKITTKQLVMKAAYYL